jgi:hypothetical protein
MIRIDEIHLFVEEALALDLVADLEPDDRACTMFASWAGMIRRLAFKAERY